MQFPATSTVRVLGTMLLTHEYDHKDICVMGYPQEACILFAKSCYIVFDD